MENKRRRIDAASLEPANEVVKLQVQSMTGECVLTLDVSSSMLGRDVLKMIVDELPFQPGVQLVLSHNSSKLLLDQTLRQQGIDSETASLSCTKTHTDLHSALRWIQGRTVSDEEFSLQGITELAGVESWHTLNNLPKSLQKLTLGKRFLDPRLNRMKLPNGLQSLTLGRYFNQPLDGLRLPEGLQSLTLGQCFNQPLDGLRLPEGLQSLILGRYFNQKLDLGWHKGLRSLTVGLCYKKKLDGLILPDSLENLTLRFGFKRKFEHLRLPENLKNLTFGERFNQTLDGLRLPEGLQSLTFGENFDRTLYGLGLPNGLQSLTFGSEFNQTLDGFKLPNDLKTLTFGDHFNQRLDGLSLPDGLESLNFGRYFRQKLDRIVLPARLRTLKLGDQSLICWKNLQELYWQKLNRNVGEKAAFLVTTSKIRPCRMKFRKSSFLQTSMMTSSTIGFLNKCIHGIPSVLGSGSRKNHPSVWRFWKTSTSVGLHGGTGETLLEGLKHIKSILGVKVNMSILWESIMGIYEPYKSVN